MNADDAMTEFKAGVDQLQNHYASKAIAHFRKAMELDEKNPFFISYLGLATAAAEQKWEEAEDLCYSAVRMMRSQAQLYVNLAEVYRLQGKRQDAIEILREGFPLTKRDERIAKALRKYGVRRTPVIPFLGREHFVNRNLGRILHKPNRAAPRRP